MKKRFESLMLFFALFLPFFTSAASAVEAIPYSSKIIDICNIEINTGSNAGEVNISYDIQAGFAVDSIGIASIKIYKSDKTYVTTITGTPTNGLIRYKTAINNSSYTYSGVSGTTYYAEVTVAAASGSLYDSRTFVTEKVTAP